MPGYKFVRESFEFTKTAIGKTGVRVFLEHTGGAFDLPEIEDPFSVIDPALLCISIKETPYHFEGEVCKKKYVCTYSTDKTITKTNANNYIHSAGMETISIEDPLEWYWVPEPWVDLDLTDGLYKAKLYKNTIRGSVSKSFLVNVSGDSPNFKSYLDFQAYPKIGKINQEVFTLAHYPYHKGTVLFPNYNATLVTDEEGTEKMQITLNFAFKILQVPEAAGQMGSDPSGNNVNYSWNFYFFPNKKTSPGYPDWQMVANKSSGTNFDTDFVYKTADFGSPGGGFSDILGNLVT